MTTLYHTLFVDRMYSLEHNNMTSLLLWLKAILPGFFPPEPRFQFQNGGCVKSAYSIKSNQITFIVTSPQHKCLGEWNSYERAPDSAKKTKQQFTYGQYVHIYRLYRRQCAKYTYTQYTQCTIKTYFVTNTHCTHSTLCTHLYIVICEGATDYNLQ